MTTAAKSLVFIILAEGYLLGYSLAGKTVVFAEKRLRTAIRRAKETPHRLCLTELGARKRPAGGISMTRARLMILTLLVLPTAALANSFIPDSVDTGNVVMGTFGLSNPFSNLVSITVMGTDATVRLSGVTTNGPCSIGVTCNFTGGTVVLTQGTSTFTATVSSGSYTVTIQGGSIFIDSLTATLKRDSQITGGTLEMTDLTGTMSSPGMVHWNIGSAVVDAEAIPEPGSLFSFGTGLVALVGIMRRKLKLGT
jgi:PEP-CTERM motif